MKRKVKLIHLISSLKLGGAETVLVNLLKQLGTVDYEHHVVYFHAGPNFAHITALGIPTYHITGGLALYDPVFWIRLYRCIKAINPALIHSHLWAANLAGRLLGRWLHIPVINTIHAQHAHHGAVRNAIDLYSLRLADHIVAVGPAVITSFQEVSLQSNKISCIANGISMSAVKLRMDEEKCVRSLFGWHSEQLVIGCVARFEPVKNFPLLIKTFARIHKKLPSTRLVLIGYGSQQKQLEDLVLCEGIKDVVAFVIGHSAYGYYALMDLFVLPSKSEADVPLAVLEAISCGVPSIVADTIQEAQLSGLVITEPSEAALEKCILRLIEYPTQRKWSLDQAQKSVEQRYSLAHMASKYHKLYGQLLEAK